MPIHFHDLDVMNEIAGVRSVLIVPCNMCPAITVAVRENRPFLNIFRNPLKSAPFEEYLGALQSRLEEKGVTSKVFRSTLYHQWFMCMWTSGQRRKLEKEAKDYDAVIAFGCESAYETVHRAVKSTEYRVIEGMELSGIMNAKLSFRLPGTITFKDCTVIPASRQQEKEIRSDRALAGVIRKSV